MEKKLLCICHYEALEFYYQAHVWAQNGIKYQQHLNQIPFFFFVDIIVVWHLAEIKLNESEIKSD